MTPESCNCRAGVTTEHVEETFTVRLDAGEILASHRHPARIVITAVRGSGVITTGEGESRVLGEGALVQLDPGAPHGVIAGAEGMELSIAVAPNCCEAC